MPQPERHIQVLFGSPGEVLSLFGATHALSWLDAREQDRARAFHYPADQDAFVAAHALLRRCVARETSVSERDIVLVREPSGRLVVGGQSGLHVSLSRRRGQVACAVSPLGPCGVDVEHVSQIEDPLSLAQRFFLAGEATWIGEVRGQERCLRFTRIWTLKEACLKAVGLGLPGALERFGFEPGTPLEAGRFVAPDLPQQALGYASRTLDNGQVLALAYAGPLDSDVVWRHV